jgi:hypothetical protein
MVATEVLLLLKVKAPGLSLETKDDKEKGASLLNFAGIVKEIVGVPAATGALQK